MVILFSLWTSRKLRTDRAGLKLKRRLNCLLHSSHTKLVILIDIVILLSRVNGVRLRCGQRVLAHVVEVSLTKIELVFGGRSCDHLT